MCDIYKLIKKIRMLIDVIYTLNYRYLSIGS